MITADTSYDSDDAVTVISNADPYSTVAHLRIDKCSLLDKPDYPVNESWEDMRDRICDLVRVPPLFDAESQEVLEVVSDRYRPSTTDAISLADLSLGTPSTTTISPSICLQDDWIAFGEVSAEGISDSLEEEVRACFSVLESQSALSARLHIIADEAYSATGYSFGNFPLHLAPYHLSFPIVDDPFPRHQRRLPPVLWLVAAYSRLRRHSDARRRTTNEIGRNRSDWRFFEPESASRSEYQLLGSGEYRSLLARHHSESSSSPLVPSTLISSGKTGSRLFIAGQIPLVPASLTLPGPFSYATEVTLSLQHVRRVVIAAQESRWTGWSELSICWIASVAEEEWNQRLAGAFAGYKATESLVRFALLRRRRWEKSDAMNSQCDAPVLFVSAVTLPKQSSIEWQVTYQTGQSISPTEESEEEDDIILEPTPTRTNRASKTFECSSTTSGSDTAGFYACQLSGEGSRNYFSFRFADGSLLQTFPSDWQTLERSSPSEHSTNQMSPSKLVS